MGNDENYRSSDNDISSKLTYLLIGGGIGAVLALLFAPKAGHELRGDIADVTRKGIDRTRDTATQLQARAGEYYEETRQRAGEIYSTASDKANQLAESARTAAAGKTGQIQAAIDAGKRAYAEEKRRSESASMLEGGPSYPERND